MIDRLISLIHSLWFIYWFIHCDLLLCLQGKYIEANECCERALLGCRWYTAATDGSKDQGQGQGQHKDMDKGQGEYKDKGELDVDGSGPDNSGNDDNDDDDDNVDEEGGIVIDMDTLHTLYNLANLLQLQGIHLSITSPNLINAQLNTDTNLTPNLLQLQFIHYPS